MATHRNCETCSNSGIVTGCISLVGIIVAIFGSGGHAIAGAILAVGLEVASVFEKWSAHQ